jgi:hypothetical protein
VIPGQISPGGDEDDRGRYLDERTGDARDDRQAVITVSATKA